MAGVFSVYVFHHRKVFICWWGLNYKLLVLFIYLFVLQGKPGPQGDFGPTGTMGYQGPDVRTNKPVVLWKMNERTSYNLLFFL